MHVSVKQLVESDPPYWLHVEIICAALGNYGWLLTGTIESEYPRKGR